MDPDLSQVEEVESDEEAEFAPRYRARPRRGGRPLEQVDADGEHRPSDRRRQIRNALDHRPVRAVENQFFQFPHNRSVTPVDWDLLSCSIPLRDDTTYMVFYMPVRAL